MRWIALLVAVLLSFVGHVAVSGATEPDDTIARATPLVSGEPIQGTIETTNDVDYYVLYADDQRQLSIALNNTSDCGLSCADARITIALLGVFQATLDQNWTDAGAPPALIFRTVPRGQYFLKVTGSGIRAGLDYSLTATAPGGFESGGCFFAQASVERAAKTLRSAKRQYARATGARKRALRTRLRSAARQLKSARVTERTAC